MLSKLKNLKRPRPPTGGSLDTNPAEKKQMLQEQYSDQLQIVESKPTTFCSKPTTFCVDIEERNCFVVCEDVSECNCQMDHRVTKALQRATRRLYKTLFTQTCAPGVFHKLLYTFAKNANMAVADLVEAFFKKLQQLKESNQPTDPSEAERDASDDTDMIDVAQPVKRLNAEEMRHDALCRYLAKEAYKRTPAHLLLLLEMLLLLQVQVPRKLGSRMQELAYEMLKLDKENPLPEHVVVWLEKFGIEVEERMARLCLDWARSQQDTFCHESDLTLRTPFTQKHERLLVAATARKTEPAIRDASLLFAFVDIASGSVNIHVNPSAPLPCAQHGSVECGERECTINSLMPAAWISSEQESGLLTTMDRNIGGLCFGPFASQSACASFLTRRDQRSLARTCTLLLYTYKKRQAFYKEKRAAATQEEKRLWDCTWF